MERVRTDTRYYLFFFLIIALVFSNSCFGQVETVTAAAGGERHSVALMDDGRIVGSGPPDSVLTEELLGRVFEPSIRVIDVDGSTVIVSLRTKETIGDQ